MSDINNELEKAKELIREECKTVYAELRPAADAELKESIKGTVDPLITEKLKKINEHLDTVEDKYEEVIAKLKARQVTESDENAPDKKLFDEYTAVFDKMARQGANKLSRGDKEIVDNFHKSAWAIGNGANTTGGYLVPTANPSEVIEKMYAIFPVMTYVDFGASSLDKYVFDLELDLGGVTSGNNETTAATTTPTGTITRGEISMHKYEAAPSATRELIADSMINLPEYINRKTALALSRQLATDFWAGNGTSAITGVLATTGASAWDTVGEVAAANADNNNCAFDLEDVYRAIYDIHDDYVMNDSNIQLVVPRRTRGFMRTMRTADGVFLWEPDVTVGEPVRFDGYAVLNGTQMPALTDTDGVIDAGQVAMLIGNLNEGYIMRKHGSFTVEIEDIYTDYAKIVYYSASKFAGGLKDARALRVLTTGTKTV